MASADPVTALAYPRLLLPMAYFDEPGRIPLSAFLHEVLERDLGFVHSLRFRGADDLETRILDGKALIKRLNSGPRRFLAAFLRLEDGTPVLASRPEGSRAATLHLAGADLASLVSHGERLKEAWLAPPRPKDERVEVNFWTAKGGARHFSRDRLLEVPRFPEIAANYPSSTRRHLQELMRFNPETGFDGRLILWHGQAGTGKTWALRALVREWEEWCQADYITDPERFLGPDPEYMLEVMVSSREDRWRLLILEDAGELLTIDARMMVGQALSRLLNLTDGLLGQGTNTLVLITTNEDLGKLHPAVIRPGRALAKVNFEPLSEQEAAAWLERRGQQRDVDGPMNVAELYAGAER